MFVDSHCHLEMESFDRDLEQVIQKSIDEGLEYILTVGTEEPYFEKVAQLIDRYPFIYGAIGIHPHNARDFDGRLEKVVRQAARHPKIVGCGEVGLDFFKNHSPKETQKKVFVKQLAMAQDMGLPIIVHSRDARQETLEILKSEYRAGGGVIHCYSYDLAAAKKFLEMGFHISIPGTITYKTAAALKDVVRYVPPERLLAETDAPFLTPVPHRGKRNVPYYVKITIDTMAKVRDMDVRALALLMRDNFARLFLGSNTKKDIS